jgi:hypothetical protein
MEMLCMSAGDGGRVPDVSEQRAEDGAGDLERDLAECRTLCRQLDGEVRRVEIERERRAGMSSHESNTEPLVIPGAAGTYFLDHDECEYRKTATIRALQIDRPFVVQAMEGDHRGNPGDWLAQGPAGELWVIADDVFRATYEQIEAK